MVSETKLDDTFLHHSFLCKLTQPVSERTEHQSRRQNFCTSETIYLAKKNKTETDVYHDGLLIEISLNKK